MSRRRRSVKRDVLPDPIYNDQSVALFVNRVMVGGKKTKAQNIVYNAFDQIKNKFPEEEPLTVFKKAIENVKPSLEVRSRRVGGATYQVPVEVRPTRRRTLAMRWIVDFARKRNEKSMSLRLANELMDAYTNKGNTFKKKEDVLKMAEANRAYSHYNW